MSDRLDVAPTRGNLNQLLDRVSGLHEAHDLLDRKRQVLMRELLDMIANAQELEDEATEVLQAAHKAMREARMYMGVDRIRAITLAPSAIIRSQVRTQSIMGVMVPLIEVKVEAPPPAYGPGDTNVALDAARDRWLDVARLVGAWAEAQLTVWRLARELRRTQRRVNALEEIVIPRHENTIGYIEDVLEEQEREDIVHAKKVKALHSNRRR